jgi:hypothetical protein
MRTSLPALGVSIIFVGALSGVPTETQDLSPAAIVPTFSKDAAPILYKHCVSCHRPGDIAPMSLLTYEQARPWARAISKAIGARTMPPWHADAPAGTFANERRLTDEERHTLMAWADGGAPAGDSKDLPQPPAFADGWSLGTPDVILEMQEDYPIPAQGTIEYEHLYVPTNFTEPKWVQSIEVRPGSREFVHHVLVFHLAKPEAVRAPLARPNQQDSVTPEQRTEGQRPRRQASPETLRRLIATYAPGTNPQAAPAGTAFRLEAGGTLEFQMHYTTNGKAGSDRTRVGIIFSKDPSPQELRAQQFINGTLKLPAGAADVAVSTDLEFVHDSTVWGLFPHTHLRGKKWAYTLVLPDGERRSILSVPRYDFNWQTYYMFKEPLQVPKGSKIVSTAWYDNSSANRFNPDPTKDVLWGDQTWEEMQYTGILLSAQ